MKTTSKWVERLTAATLPLAFFGSGFLNIVAFPLGLHAYDTARTLVTFGILGAVALFLFCRVVLLYAKIPDLRRPILTASLILVLFGLVYLWALIIRADKVSILKGAMVEGCYLVSAWSALILILAEKRMRSFLRVCRIYALILSPIILYYCIRFYLPSANYYTRNLGSVNYMSLAYTLLQICVALLLEILLYDTDPKKAAVFFRLDLGLYALFSAAIALSGTKGTVLCLVFASAVLVPYLVKKSAPPAGIYFHFFRACFWCFSPLYSSRIPA